MKKFLCIIISLLLVFNTTVVYADEHGGSSGSFDPDDPRVKYPELFDENGHVKPAKLPGQELFGHMILADPLGTAAAPILSAIDDIFKNYDNSDDSISFDKGGSTIHFHERFINEFNQKVQDKVHALDGYWLFEPASISPANVTSLINLSVRDWSDYANLVSQINLLKDKYTFIFFSGNDTFSPKFYAVNCDELYIVSNSYGWVNVYDSSLKSVDIYSSSDNGYSSYDCLCIDFRAKSVYRTSPSYAYNFALTNRESVNRCLGIPFKVFYSYQDLKNYLNNGKQRTYAPKLPNVTIKIPVKYINNSVSLPDITYNITTENKTEVEIQNQYDTTIKNYLDSLDDFSDGSTTTPTPTPSGGFTDGTTPTPTPAIGDGGDDSGNGKVDLSEITDLLKKILDKLTSFADSHSKFEQTITDYIEANDGKLDQIIDAIDKLSQGKEDGEDYKCKYDYTELSDYLKKLWNDSDKKFDTMIDLLEENNEYQQKLVDTLDSIKSILIKESIMDSFKDRSKETANKAKEKFPTSVPWDIAIVINAMSATPEEPKFNLPIKIASLNIDENIEVDLSSGEWEKLAKTCRYMLSLLFVLFMVQLSRRLFFNKGDDD